MNTKGLKRYLVRYWLNGIQQQAILWGFDRAMAFFDEIRSKGGFIEDATVTAL